MKVAAHSTLLLCEVSASPTFGVAIVTVTPSEFLDMAPEPERLGRLWAGSWHNADFSIWIGEEEENRAWELLRETRVFLQTYITGRNRDTVTPEESAVLSKTLPKSIPAPAESLVSHVISR